MKLLKKPVVCKRCNYLTLQKLIKHLEKNRHKWLTRQQICDATHIHPYAVNFFFEKLKEKNYLEVAQNDRNLFFMVKLKPEYKEGQFP